MDRSQTGEGRQVLGAGEVHGNNPPQQPSSEEKLDDLQMRGEGNLLGFGKHWDKTWSYVWFNDQKWVSWAFGKEAAVTAGQEKWHFTSGSWHKLVSFAAWAKRMGLAEARELPSTPGKPARPICSDHECAMTGPHTANKNALAQNKGLGFFSCPKRCAACRQWARGPTEEKCAALTGGECCGKKGFLWANGSEADSEVSHRRKAAYDAAMQAQRETAARVAAEREAKQEVAAEAARLAAAAVSRMEALSKANEETVAAAAAVAAAEEVAARAAAAAAAATAEATAAAAAVAAAVEAAAKAEAKFRDALEQVMADDDATRAPRETRETGPAPSKRARLDDCFEPSATQARLDERFASI